MYQIEIRSNYEELYRYNIITMCGGYDSAGEQLYAVGVEKIYNENIAPAHLEERALPPQDFEIGEVITLECAEAHAIHAIVYVITNCLPTDRTISNSPPFPIQVTISKRDEVIYDTTHEVNQWGGATINIKL